SLLAKCWSPVPGDQRLALEHEREGQTRPALWDLSSGVRTDLRPELEGEVGVEDWWPDGSALLLKNLVEGRHRLFRFDVATGDLQGISSEPGTVLKARVRPDGRVWFLHERGHRRRRVVDETGAEMMPLPGALPPAA